MIIKMSNVCQNAEVAFTLILNLMIALKIITSQNKIVHNVIPLARIAFLEVIKIAQAAKKVFIYPLKIKMLSQGHVFKK